MKNLFRFLMAVAILFTASCAKEDISTSLVGNGETVEVTFSANLADLGTRAYGDGTYATKLRYVVYDANDASKTPLALSDDATSDSGHFDVRLQLVKGMKYDILFWADHYGETGPYTIDGGKVKVNYTGIKANDDTRDAFFAIKDNFQVGDDTDVYLYRPFAQLNAYTTDWNDLSKSGITLTGATSYVKTSAYSILNPFASAEDVLDVESETEVTFAHETHDDIATGYLTMNYLLVPSTKYTANVELEVIAKKIGSDTETVKLPKAVYTCVPFKRNYKTNIKGSLLTKSTDFQVTILPGFGDENGDTEEVKVYSGAMSEQIAITANGYYIFDNLTLSVESGAAVSIAEGLDNVKIGLKGNVYIESKNGSGIGVGAGSKLTLNGGNLTAKGNGNHAFGIGGNGAIVTLDGVTVDYACGGHIQPLFVNDTKYGKSEPEGGAAIGGAEVNILNSTITKVDGGSKAAAIGAQYWQSAVIKIENSTILEANGGNASAGIGGSRYGNNDKYNLEINIINSTITATGGQGGAGIGSGYDTHCNGQNYTATNEITIDAASTITATGGKYAAGIGTGFHSAYLSGAIAAGATINAVSGEKFYKDTYTEAQNIGYGVVDPAREFSGNNANVTFTVAGQIIDTPKYTKSINSAEALANVSAGDTIKLTDDITLSAELTLPAGVTLNGNGKQINGTIYAGGNLTFVGHTKVTAFSASYYDRVITIGEGACLEVTGTGRVSLAYGNTFNITGNIADAKSADKTTIQPSLIIPGGISITGGSNAAFNVTNAYVKIGSTSSKNSAANGTFTLNITNSIAEFTDQLTFAEPTSGKNPTFNINVTNSVLTTATKLCIAAPNTNMVVDNSTITLGSYFRNSGKVELKNGSVLTGSTILFGENGGNNGQTIVDNSTFTISASSTGHALDGKGTGSITLTNNAEASVTYYKAITVTTDATSTFSGTEVQ